MGRFLKTAALTATLMLAAQAALAAEHIVHMKNNGKDGIMVFEPGYVNAKVGDTVKFVPTDAGHNSQSVEVPDGANTWAGDISKEVTVTLNKEGVYVYKCVPHAPLNMAGIIQVGKPVNMDAATKAVNTLTQNAATNKDRLKGYLSQVK